MRRGALLLVAMAAVFTGPAVGGAAAATCTLVDTNVDWKLATWSCGHVPTASDDVVIPADKRVVIIGGVPASPLSLTLTGNSQVEFDDATSLTVGTAILNGGSLLSTGIAGSFTANSLIQGTTNQLSVDNTVVVANGGSWNDGSTCLVNGGILRITGAFHVASAADNLDYCGGALPLVYVAAAGGSMEVAGGTRTISAPLEVDGLLQLDGGNTILAGATPPGTNDGAISIAAPATLTVPSSILPLGATGALTGAGTLDILGGGTVTAAGGSTVTPANLTLAGTLAVNGSTGAATLPSVLLVGGTLAGTRARTIGVLDARSGMIQGASTPVTGAFTKTTSGTLTLDATTLTSAVDLDLTAGSLCAQNNGIFQITHAVTVKATFGDFLCASGRIEVQPTGSITSQGGTHAVVTPLNMDGLFTLTSGLVTLQSPSVDTNAGGFSVQVGSDLQFAAPVTIGGTGSIGGAGIVETLTGAAVTLQNGATFSPSSLNVIAGSILLQGTAPATTLPSVTLLGGTLAGARNRTINALDARSGAIVGPGTTTVALLFTKTTGGQLLVESGPLVLNADATWATGDLCVQNAGTLRLTHTFTIGSGAGAMPCSGGGAQVDVTASGTLQRQSLGTTMIATPVVNHGAVVLPGTGGGYTMTGGLTLAGGVLQGSGSVGGSVVNDSGIVKPGASPGRISIDGSYTQGAGGTLEIEANGATAETLYDVLDIGGPADLDGTLAIVKGGGFDPAPGTNLQIITSNSRTGTFSTVAGAAFAGSKHYSLLYGPATVSLIIDVVAPTLALVNVVSPPEPGKKTAHVSYTATATDNVDQVTPVCAPASGSVFRSGVTTVSCSVTDSSGNAKSGTFTVTVKRCVKNGTRRANRLNGTGGRDGICGLGGNDRIKGLGGDDILDGGLGSDTIVGGAGVDELVGGAGNDTINGRGDRKRDIVKCGTGRHDLALVDRLDKVARDCETVRRA